MDTRARSLEGAGGEIASPEKNHEWFNPRGAFEPQFDINAGSIPSSQSTVPSEFRKIPNDDYFDVTKLHPAVQSRFTAVPESGVSVRTQVQSWKPPTSKIAKILRKQWESWQVEAVGMQRLEAQKLENLVGKEKILNSEMKWKSLCLPTQRCWREEFRLTLLSQGTRGKACWGIIKRLFLSRFRKNDASKAVMADQEDFSSDDEEQEEEEANEEDEHEYMADEEEENHGVKGENDHQKDEEVEKEAPATRKGGHLRSSWSLPMQV